MINNTLPISPTNTQPLPKLEIPGNRVELEKKLAVSMRNYFNRDFIQDKNDAEVIYWFCLDESAPKPDTPPNSRKSTDSTPTGTPKKLMTPISNSDGSQKWSQDEETKDPFSPEISNSSNDSPRFKESISKRLASMSLRKVSNEKRRLEAIEEKNIIMSEDDSAFLTSAKSMRNLRSRESVVDLSESSNDSKQSGSPNNSKQYTFQKSSLYKKSVHDSTSSYSIKIKRFSSKFFNTLNRRFCAAVFKNDYAIVEHFIERKIVDINYVHRTKTSAAHFNLTSTPLNFLLYPYEPATSLSFAVAKGRYAMTELLIKKEALVEIPDALDNNPLHIAAHNDDIKIMKLLLKITNINLKNKKGDTAIMVAAKAKKWKAVCELLNHKADITLKNSKHETVYEIAREGLDRRSYLLDLLSTVQLRLFSPLSKAERKLKHQPLKILLKTPSEKGLSYFYNILLTPFKFFWWIIIFPFSFIKKCLFGQPNNSIIKRDDLPIDIFKKIRFYPETLLAIEKNDLSCIESCIKYDANEVYHFSHYDSQTLIKLIIDSYDKFILILKKNVRHKLKLDRPANERELNKYYFGTNYSTLYQELKSQQQEFRDKQLPTSPAPQLTTEDDIL